MWRLRTCSIALAAWGAPWQVWAQQADATEPSGFGMLSMALIIPGVVFAMWRVRQLLVRHVSQEMLRASPDATAELAAEPDAELAAAAPLMFEVHDADHAPPAGSLARQQCEAQALRLFRRVSAADLGIALLYIVLPNVGGLGASTDAVVAGILWGLLGVVYTALRYRIHRLQFRAYDLSRSRRTERWVRRFTGVGHAMMGGGDRRSLWTLMYAPDLVRGFFGGRMRTVLSVLPVGVSLVVASVFMSEGGAAMGSGVGLIAAALLHVLMLCRLGGALRADPGRRLLILRVFDIDATSSFVFEGLMRYWRHFGNHFTIVDAMLVRQAQSQARWRMVLGFLLGCGLLLLGSTVVEINYPTVHAAWAFVVVGVPLLVVAALFVTVGRWRISARFTRSHAQMLKRLNALERRPRQTDLSFRHTRALCHDNTWFPTVKEFARRSNVVLMDLRGYSPARQGCQREVDFLFDAVPLARLLFLVEAPALALVTTMLHERWASLAASSPNLGLQAPTVQLYVPVEASEREMQAILDRLLEIAAR